MLSHKSIDKAASGTLLSFQQRKRLAEKLDGTTHVTYADMRKISSDFESALVEKIANKTSGKKNLKISQNNDLTEQKILLNKIIDNLEESTSVKLKWKETDLDSGKVNYGGVIKSLELQLCTAIENDTAKHVSHSFSEGDKIRMGANTQGYNYTRVGSEGVVIGPTEPGKYNVRFTLQTGDPSRGEETWEVEGQYMEHRSPSELAKKEGGAKKIARKLVSNCVAEVIAHKEKDKFVDMLIADLIDDKYLIKMNGFFGINLNRSFELLGGNLAKAYANHALYTSPDMFSPPAERKVHVLRLELTTGCDYNACTYCGGYKGIPYKEKSLDEFKAHYYAVKKVLGGHKNNIKRVFIGGGNALNVNLETLSQVVSFLYREFDPRRISIYGRADAIKEKGRNGLYELKQNGLGLIYWGVESGSADVLKYVCKRTTPDEMLAAGYAAELASMNLSVMVMPGLGGMKHYQSHVEGTVKLLNEIRTKYVTFMAINVAENSVYSQKMAEGVRLGTNRPLTEREIVEQVRDIMNGMLPKGQKVGIFDQTIDQVGYNPISFNVEFGDAGKREALQICGNYLKKTAE
ncbi:Uncharacterised protein [uncultured archaeon]|nr:Uncharacterised protein [uncultured archaeon]